MRFQAEESELWARGDSINTALATLPARFPQNFDPKECRQTRAADSAYWELVYDESDFIKNVLTPGQIDLINNLVVMEIAASKKRRIALFHRPMTGAAWLQHRRALGCEPVYAASGD